MNNSELDKLLKSARVPDRPPEFWEALPKRVTAKLHWQAGRPAAPEAEPRRFAAWAWGFGAAAACVAAALLVLALPGRTPPAAGHQFALVERCFREIEALFPRQVQAVVVDERGPRMVLADSADVPQSPPVYLKICGPKGCQRIITFSGQQIRVNGDQCDVLMDAAGHVLVVGSRIVWSSASAASAAGPYHIEARLVASAS